MSILLPALFAGLVAIGVTLAIERWGGRAGGLIGTLPSTIVPAAIGIFQHAVSVDDFQAAMFITPAGMFVDVLFLLVWQQLPSRLPRTWSLSRRLTLMTVASLTVWFVVATLVISGVDQLRRAVPSLFGFAIIVTLSIVVAGILACRRLKPAPKGQRKVSMVTLIMRGVLAALAIGLAIALTRFVGPLIGGVMTTFPAIFLTTMIAVWLAQGEAVQAGAVGPMMLGSTSVATFALVGAHSLPALGLVLGSVVAWLAAACLATLPAWLWLQRQRRAASSVTRATN